MGCSLHTHVWLVPGTPAEHGEPPPNRDPPTHVEHMIERTAQLQQNTHNHNNTNTNNLLRSALACSANCAYHTATMKPTLVTHAN
jgi:hypothetical protein